MPTGVRTRAERQAGGLARDGRGDTGAAGGRGRGKRTQRGDLAANVAETGLRERKSKEHAGMSKEMHIE